MDNKREATLRRIEYSRTFALKTSSKALHVFIALNLAFSPVIPWRSIAGAATTSAETASPEMSRPDQNIITHLSQIERGEAAQWPTAEADLFKLVDQSIEILSGRSWITIDLNTTAVEIPIVPFTSLKIVYDAQAKELIFQGLRGVDSKGENGQIVGVGTSNAAYIERGGKLMDLAKQAPALFSTMNGLFSVEGGSEGRKNKTHLAVGFQAKQSWRERR